MGIRIQNNTNLEMDQLIEMYKHYLILVDKTKISSVVFDQRNMKVFSGDELLGKFEYGRSYVANGYVLNFDQSKGEGVIKTKNGDYVTFFSSNVKGANGTVPHLVTNVSFREGERVKFKLSGDNLTTAVIGALEVRRAL